MKNAVATVPSRSRRPIIARWLAVGALACAAIVGNVPAAQADIVYNFTLPGGGDSFSNYDFNSSGAADWPIDIIFDGNAQKYLIQNSLVMDNFPFGGSTEYALTGGTWDRDGGQKQYRGGCSHQGDSIHVRLYAYQQHMYNSLYGYFVIGETHDDVSEGCAGGYTTHNEWDEAAFATFWQNAGHFVYRNTTWLNNYHNPGPGFNDGYATEIAFP